ncbi:MAG: ATP-binding protein [Bacteroidota bacterium]
MTAPEVDEAVYHAGTAVHHRLPLLPAMLYDAERDAEVVAAVTALFQTLGTEEPAVLDGLLALLAPHFAGLGTGPDDFYADPEAFVATIRIEQAQMPYATSWDSVWTDVRRLRDDLAIVAGKLRLLIQAEPEELTIEPRYTFVLERLDGRWLLAHCHFSVEDALLDPGATLATALERRNRDLELLVERRTAELNQSLADLTAAQARLVQQEKMASLGMLTAGVAHEIKNPLNFVTNFASLSRELLDDLDAEDDPEEAEALRADLRVHAERIEAHARRADGIVRAMLDHARTGESALQPTDLNALVDQHIDLAWHGARARDPGFAVEVVRDFDAEAGRVDLAPQEIGRVLLNLLGNAFDALTAAATPGARVIVTTRRNSNRVEVRVSDNGPGVLDDLCAKVFEPFFTTKPTGQGIGLGLSLSYDIVTQGHGGTLDVEPTPGGGATFVLALPANASKSTAPDSNEAG